MLEVKKWSEQFDKMYDGYIKKVTAMHGTCWYVDGIKLKIFISSLLKSQKEELIEKETCICAAIKFLKREKEVVLLGHRHADCFHNRFNRPDKKEYKELEQGFMTSKNRFVGREEGRELQDKAGIESVADWGDEKGYTANTLFSEDLY